MIVFRSFRNDDPPHLAEVWTATDLGPAAMRPMNAAILEAAVFSKPFFDPEGLLVAVEDGHVIGFAHAAFGPNHDQSALDHRVGTTLLVVVVPRSDADRVAAGLLERSEEYLRRRGATAIYGGGSAATRSFYLGLYGGSELPGILDSSPQMQAVFRRAGYVEAERIAVLRRPLAGFRPPVNRLQLAIRRSTTLHAIDEPLRRTWWEAATTSGISLRRYELFAADGHLLGTATVWDVQPLASAWGVTAAGLLHVGIEGPRRRQGLAHYLVAEALHDLADEGIVLAETQVTESNQPAVSLFLKLGFEAVARGTLFRRADA